MDNASSFGPAVAAPAHPATRTLRVLVFPWIGLMAVFVSMLQIFVPLQVQALAPDTKVSALGLLVGLGAAFAALTNPVAGSLSDRGGSRFGRRTPWLLGSALATALALMMLGRASSMGMLMLMFCITQVAANVYQANLTAVMPDRVPTERRGLAAAVIGIGLPLGGATGAILASRHVDHISLGYGLIGAVLLACTAVFLLADREAPAAAKPVDASARRGFASLAAFLSPFSHRDYRWTFCARFLFMLGEMLLSSFLLYIVQDFIKLAPGRTAAAVVAELAPVSMGAMLVAAALSGWLSDRIKRRVPFVALAALLLMINCAVLYLMRDERGVLIFYIVNGLAFGCFLAAAQALSAEVLPDPRHMARDLGVMSIAAAGPQVVAPMIGSLIINQLGGYAGLLGASALVLALAAASLLGIRTVK